VVVTKDRTFALSLERSEAELLEQMAEIIEERGGFEPVVIKDADDQIGVVTVHDGPGLPSGELIAPLVGVDPEDTATYHNSFQEAEKFLAAGGRKGRQLQVLVEGTYYINRLFATVERIDKTVVEVGQSAWWCPIPARWAPTPRARAIATASWWPTASAACGATRCCRASTPSTPMPARSTMVPTTNFILKWETMAVGSHKFDENLAEVSLITRDAFEPTLPLSVVVHIDYRKAPLVIQRFGDIKKLVEQTLDPMVSAYFKNIGADPHPDRTAAGPQRHPEQASSEEMKLPSSASITSSSRRC
jgi:uncharacterized membrane protein YqiK